MAHHMQGYCLQHVMNNNIIMPNAKAQAQAKEVKAPLDTTKCTNKINNGNINNTIMSIIIHSFDT